MKRLIAALVGVCLLLPCVGGMSGCSKQIPLLSIVHDGSYLQRRYAHEWMQMLVETVDAIDTEKVGMTETAPPDDCYRIELCASDAIENGHWRMEAVNDRLLRVYAADGYGFVAASRYFSGIWRSAGAYPAGTSEGSYLYTLTEHERACAYAYDRQGDMRVMFYNVLWGNPAPEERNLINAETVARYLPDVLGLQEVNKTRRGNAADGKGGLIALLAQLGYEEAIDPRVRNLYATDESIPGTDASLTTDDPRHVELGGYGTGGGIRVSYNGESFYTYFNCAPLLYNTQTTKLIAADYYWYKNQWDRRAGIEHENSAGDCASKAATWGVFESLQTGERYIAISTHMCTRSDYIRGLQGEEMVALIEELSATYQCPVILGGDYNGTYTAANYRAFEQGGLTDVERAGLASVYTSKLRGHHTYPVYQKDAELVLPDANDNTGTLRSDKSVDHIMINDTARMQIGIFGVVVDDCTMSGADHFPMVMDFSIRANEAENGT